MTSPSFKLTYFNFAGRAEPIRLAFYIGGIPFEDNRISFEEFGATKESYPFNSLPTLSVDGRVISQSAAILRYVGRQAGLYPRCPVQGALVDEILGATDDLTAKIGATLKLSGEEKTAARKELADVTIPKWLAFLEAAYNRINSSSAFFVGNSLTVADLRVSVLTQWLRGGILDGIPTNIVDQYNGLNASIDAVAAHPKVVEYYGKPKLHYFDIEGRGGSIRMALHFGGIEFDEVILPYGPEFFESADKDTRYPYGAVPVLEHRGHTIAQSNGLTQYAGKLAGLYPTCALAALQVDEVLEVTEDILNLVLDTIYAPADKIVAQKKEMNEITLPKWYGNLEAVHKRNHPNGCDSVWFVGNSLTVADLKFYVQASTIFTGAIDGICPKVVFKDTPRLRTLYQAVDQHEKTIAYKASRAKASQ